MPTLEELAQKNMQGSGQTAKKSFNFDREEELGAVPKGKQAIVLRKLVKGKDVYYDLRVFYWDKTENKFKPTSKGVMMTAEQFLEVRKFMGIN